MHSLVRDRLPQVVELCRRHSVRKLTLFGSAARADFDPERSDIDMVVEFDALAPSAYADAYFGLLEDLEQLLQRSVDLVERKAIRNPRLRNAIERSEVSLYNAA